MPFDIRAFPPRLYPAPLYCSPVPLLRFATPWTSVAASRQMDVALYVGLTVACLVIGGLGFFLARIVQRKGRDHSLYSMARSGKLRKLYI